MKKGQEKSKIKNKAIPQENAKKKKPWEKPQLIVLYRARPEESVLITCKGLSGQTSGPGRPARCLQAGLWCSENAPT